jgi:hypothetical protein
MDRFGARQIPAAVQDFIRAFYASVSVGREKGERTAEPGGVGGLARAKGRVSPPPPLRARATEECGGRLERARSAALSLPRSRPPR